MKYILNFLDRLLISVSALPFCFWFILFIPFVYVFSFLWDFKNPKLKVKSFINELTLFETTKDLILLKLKITDLFKNQ